MGRASLWRMAREMTGQRHDRGVQRPVRGGGGRLAATSLVAFVANGFGRLEAPQRITQCGALRERGGGRRALEPIKV